MQQPPLERKDHMVARGLILPVSDEQNQKSIKFFGWLYLSLHRYKLPDLYFCIFVFALGGIAQHSIVFFLAGILLYEVFILSLTFHEYCHMLCARFLGLRTDKVLLVPYSLGIRTAFGKEGAISETDFIVVLLAGPFIPLAVTLPVMMVCFLFQLNIAVLLICLIFSFINIASLLPLKGSDGARAIKYLAANKQDIKLVFMTLLAFVLSSLRILDLEKIKKEREADDKN